jgi:hypothetical protein
VKLKPMRAKQLVAVTVLLIVALLLVFPPLLSGGAEVTLSSTTSVHADHVYVTIGEISAHRADISGASAWQSISNKSTRVDLMLANISETVAMGTLPLGEYETVRVKVTNATVIINGTSRKVHLESSVFTIPFSFLTRFGTETVIMLKVAPEVQETSEGVDLRLAFSAVPAGSST